MPPRRPRRRGAPSIIGPTDHPARCSGGRARHTRGRPHPGVAAIGRATTPTPIAPWPRRARSRPTSRTSPRSRCARSSTTCLRRPARGCRRRSTVRCNRRPTRRRGPRSPPAQPRWAPWRPSSSDVFAERAQAVAQLRAAVYGFLGMQPIAPADAPPMARHGDGRRERPPVRHPGHEPHCRRRRAAWRGRTPSTARCNGHCWPRRRPREAPAVGLGDPPAGVAGRQCGGPGRPRGHLGHAGGDALRRPAHRSPHPSRPADATGHARRTSPSSARPPRSA